MAQKKSKKAKAPEKDVRFDFLVPGPPGAMAVLVNEKGHQVRLAEWPQSLLDMLWAGALRGRAHEYASKLAQDRLVGKLIGREPCDTCYGKGCPLCDPFHEEPDQGREEGQVSP